MRFICSLITVENVGKSRLLYEKILNQKVRADYGENVAFEGGFALHSKGHFRELIDGKEITSGSNNFELYFEDDDILELQGILTKSGFEFLHEAREQPWRQLVMRFYDYDRNIVEVGERMEHVAYRLHLESKNTETIAAITYMTPSQVEAAVREYTPV